MWKCVNSRPPLTLYKYYCGPDVGDRSDQWKIENLLDGGIRRKANDFFQIVIFVRTVILCVRVTAVEIYCRFSFSFLCGKKTVFTIDVIINLDSRPLRIPIIQHLYSSLKYCTHTRHWVDPEREFFNR